MKTQIKRTVSMVIAILMLISLVPITDLGVTAQAARSGNFEYSVSNGKATITGFNDEYSGDLVIPDTLGGYSVTSIGNGAFISCSELTSVIIPDSVTVIGEDAFYYCDELKSVTIPNSVRSIGNCAFAQCESLKNINVDKNNKKYVSTNGILFNKDKTVLIMYPCLKSETKYVIPNSVKSIGNCAFANCKNLKSITMSDNVTTIGYEAFYNCENLTNINISNGVTEIGDNTFDGCESLTKITVPENVTIIGDEAFVSCESLKSIDLPDKLTRIGNSAFAYTAYSKKSSNWKNGVLYIDNYLIDAKSSLS